MAKENPFSPGTQCSPDAQGKTPVRNADWNQYDCPEEFSNEVNQVEMRSSEPTYAECLALITFTDDYLQPGLIKHNRPLFIS